MKRLIKKFRSSILITLLLILLSVSVVLASDSVQRIYKVPFEYNILTTIPNNSPIDTKVENKIRFSLFEEMDDIYYNGKLLSIENESFEVDITGLSGETTFIFTNSNKKVAMFKYYLSDESGFLNGYKLLDDKDLNVYITTFKGIKIIYTDKEKDSVKKLTSYIDVLPDNVLDNINIIKMIPYDNTSNIAGVTKGNIITLYKFSKYSAQTQKNIIYHEIGHTWASKLMDKQIIDYSYSEYSKIAQKDNKSVSKYSHQFATENGRYSEDFADSFAFFFISSTFSNKYPNRAAYIKSLLEK